MLLETTLTAQPPLAFLQTAGEIFAIFDQQDSGNVSYGITVNGQRYFVKTAGDPNDTEPYLDHAGRVTLLCNAVVLAHSCQHATLCPLHNVIESPAGPILVYAWAEGELLAVPQTQRTDPASAYQRFRALPVTEIIAVLNQLYDLHRHLAAGGWIACDLYDGCIIYDFASRNVHFIDLDTYHQGPFTNTMGRMFGSSRFMAPEEFTLGATIDQRTTLFTLGRMAANFLSDGTLERGPFRGNDAQHAVMLKACASKPEARFSSVAEFVMAWDRV